MPSEPGDEAPLLRLALPDGRPATLLLGEASTVLSVEDALVSSWDLSGRPYALVREIGRGGFGVVWEARDTASGREVAFKAVRAARPAATREARLLEEAEITAGLSHPNIVALRDAGVTEHAPCLVLELLRGRTLAERLGPGPMAAAEPLRAGVQVARALAHAHARGVVHRDLKPENVFLCQGPHVWMTCVFVGTTVLFASGTLGNESLGCNHNHGENYFAALEFRLPLALGVAAFLTLLIGLAILGAASGTSPGLAAALSPFCLAVPAAILAHRIGWSWSFALGVPFVLPVFVWALLNSTLKTLWRGGIRWRDTLYPLETLRAGSVR